MWIILGAAAIVFAALNLIRSFQDINAVSLFMEKK